VLQALSLSLFEQLGSRAEGKRPSLLLGRGKHKAPQGAAAKDSRGAGAGAGVGPAKTKSPHAESARGTGASGAQRSIGRAVVREVAAEEVEEVDGASTAGASGSGSALGDKGAHRSVVTLAVKWCPGPRVPSRLSVCVCACVRLSCNLRLKLCVLPVVGGCVCSLLWVVFYVVCVC
jgi:hypothetical protein